MSVKVLTLSLILYGIIILIFNLLRLVKYHGQVQVLRQSVCHSCISPMLTKNLLR